MRRASRFEGGIGAIIGIALRFAFLDLAQQRVEACVVLVDRKADAGKFGEEIGFAGLVGNQHAAAVADAFRRHMLIGLGLLDDGRGMDAGLGGEGAPADIGRLAHWGCGSAARQKRAIHG